ncbi:hypothetical protein BUL40_09715 [Croceivirga radicis]|uniref:Abortive phage infection protein C-terminal domain-containing protein n=1 Tax=Croceivirga radicis TaxID=1929488 RepID=A0A1V6LRH8_9FLAO|nr:AIPR family protein [Croceivirga radicis]OQD42784.1 hypothetical protein BUL40_09715 [Croceivirga radicis]
MASIDQKIETFIDSHFPDIDYSILGNNSESEIHRKALRYEYFVNSIEYYTVQKVIDSEEIKSISTGDLRGIDGMYVILNNQFISFPEKDDSDFYTDWKDRIIEIIDESAKIDAKFVFIQSKSSKIELDKFKGVCDAVYDIFNDQPSDLHSNRQVQTVRYLYEKVCEKEHKLELDVKICAINKDIKTLERTISDAQWTSAIAKQKRDLKSIIFSDVSIGIKSGQEYLEKLEAILAPNQRDYPVKDLKDRFIEITNDKATCYIGYLNLDEINELITTEDDDLDDVFFDNIRYFEGFGDDDSVNSKIYKSLSHNDSIFHLLHNGITITAHSKHFNPQNGNLEIKAFSIINGCQTSNIIYEWVKDNSHSSEYLKTVNIPVKIIITGNTDLRALITETANTANDVKTIQLISITDEAKAIQNMFNIEVRSGDRLYYERLSNQYPEIGESYKIQTTDLFRSYYSTFGVAPHKLTVGYGGFEREMLKRKDFLGTKSNGQTKQDLRTYYISSIAFNYLERFLRSKYPYLLSLRHHFLLLLFISVDKEFHTKVEPYKRSVPENIITGITKLVESKSKFDTRLKKICDLAVDNFDFFIEKTPEKTKVKSKSYYTEEGTEKMIKKFLEKY